MMMNHSSVIISNLSDDFVLCTFLNVFYRYNLLRMERTQQQHDAADAARRDRTMNEQECPICISEPRFAVKTNCGHLFCGKLN